MTQEAIQEDVSTDDKVEIKMTRQDEMREKIAADREAARNEELGIEPEEIKEEIVEDEPIEDPEDNEDDVPEEKQVEMITFTDEEGNEHNIPKTSKLKLKIDGEEIEESIDNVSRNYQKGAAGDKRLEQASKLMGELSQRTEALTQQEQNFYQQVQAAKKQEESGDLSTDDFQAKMKDLAAALVDADEDTAAELLTGVIKQNSRPQVETYTPSADEVAEKVLNRIAERDSAKALESAQAKFNKEYSHLAKDEDFHDMVNKKTVEVQGDPDYANATPWEIIDESAKRVEKKFGLAQKEAPKKMIKKKASPTPMGRRASIGQDPPPPETRKDVIAEMRKSRGQPT